MKSLAYLSALLIFVSVLLSSQMKSNKMENWTQDDYSASWKEVEAMDKKGLPKSALPLVEDILMKARREKNPAQEVRSLVYIARYTSELSEEGALSGIQRLEEEAASSRFPADKLLYSLAADAYWNHYQQNRYYVLQRTTMAGNGELPEDLLTWDIHNYISKVIDLQEKALEDSEKLKEVPIKLFDAILEKGDKASRFARPTLYDFVAHKAIGFFSSGESRATLPSDLFSPDARFFETEKFISTEIAASDSLSFSFQTLKLYQALEAFHTDKKQTIAQVTNTLARLSFVKKESGHPDKNKLYQTALEELLNKYTADSISSHISYDLATHLYGLPFEASVADDPNRQRAVEALAICEAAIKKYPESTGAVNCSSLKARILAPHMDFQLASIALADRAVLAKLSYSNLASVHFRLVKLDKMDKLERQRDNGERLDHLLGRKSIKEWSVEVPKSTDYRAHSFEFDISAIPFGEYALIASDGKAFDKKDNALAHASFTTSNLSYLYRQNESGSADLYTVDRETGAPKANVSVSFYEVNYNWQSRTASYTKVGESRLSDKNGYVKIIGRDRGSIFMGLAAGDDHLISDENIYINRSRRNNTNRNTRTHFFTDRAIYRPGQTVYFKGIVVNEVNGVSSSLATGEVHNITLSDPNGQKVSDLKVKTNDYGSLSGSFVLPTGGLNGNFRIWDQNGNHYFNVEDYKRPRFEVTFDTLGGNYRLGEMITATGKAIAYAGSNLTDAKVSFRVVRSARFPDWGYWWYGDHSWFRPIYPSSPEQVITSGAVETSADGTFEITFEAIPDEGLRKKWDPTFVYRIEADVTDISGETQSGNTAIAVAYKSLQASIQHDRYIDSDEEQSFAISTKNYSDKNVAATGTIKIARLKTPAKIYRSARWSAPDQFYLSEKDYRESFPLDGLADDNNPEKWAESKTVYNETFATDTEGGKLDFNPKKWAAGEYRIILETKDGFGETVEYKSYFSLTSTKSKQVPGRSALWMDKLEKVYEPGETVVLRFGSPLPGASIICQVSHRVDFREKQIVSKWLLPSNASESGQIHEVRIPIEEAHRGGIAVELRMVSQNRLLTKNFNVNVPWSNKKLDVSLETFRSKIEPGSEEEWRIKIKGPGGEKIAAELLVSMYDASLDAFVKKDWGFIRWPANYSYANWSGGSFGSQQSRLTATVWQQNTPLQFWNYDQLKFGEDHRWIRLFGSSAGSYSYKSRGRNRSGPVPSMASEMEMADGDAVMVMDANNAMGGEMAKSEALEDDDSARFSNGNADKGGKGDEKANAKTAPVPMRSDLRETAFFFPQLKTDEEGNIVFSFKSPEALTRWKLRGLAHDKELRHGQVEEEILTQKELMVLPNLPRFFRQGDKLVLRTKIASLQDKTLQGTAYLSLLDARSMQEVTQNYLSADQVEKSFSIDPKGNVAVSWELAIPEDASALICQIGARAGSFADGEEAPVPVLTNRMLVTESLPLPIRKAGSKNFSLDKLVQQSTNGSSTLRNHQLSLEFTSNPAWYAVQALPYMMEYPYECAEQTFSRYYANSIASYLANSDPRIRSIFNQWKGTDALKSNLEKNQDLKALLLEETPWVLAAKNESERKQRIGLLFDENNMRSELRKSITKLQQLQNGDGGWSWFKGGRSNEFITRHIIAGFGHLEKLGISTREDYASRQLIEQGIRFLDDQMQRSYIELERRNTDMKKYRIGSSTLHYLYARSFYLDVPVNAKNQKAFKFYLGKANLDWLDRSIYQQGLTALLLDRYTTTNYMEVTSVPQDIINSLSERAMHDEEMGMYWKQNTSSYYWYQAPIETQSLLIEMYHEVAKEPETVDELKVWLLKQKQTQDWKTTKATAEACYALLRTGGTNSAGSGTGSGSGSGETNSGSWLISDELVQVALGGKTVEIDRNETEAGTGYFRKDWHATEINSKMGEVKVSKTEDGVSWGALYWQYFEDLDKITPAETPLSIEKELFIEIDDKSGKQLQPITEATPITVGDLIKVRVILKVDRDLEYVHLKDMRASGFEPLNVLSGYRYKSGLGYYESTRDAATNFFIGWLRKGTWVFEYDLRASQEGNFSNGITTVQCMYAPEFSAHSEGIRVTIKEN